MGRAGIYKSEVQRARESLLASGRYPSIDAIRVEMGNTGSKGTIHRYLKEIESEETTAIVAPDRSLSQSVQQYASMLATQLEAEARVALDALRTEHQIEMARLRESMQATEEAGAQAELALQGARAEQELASARLARASERIATLEQDLSTSRTQLLLVQTQLQEGRARQAQADELVRTLQHQLARGQEREAHLIERNTQAEQQARTREAELIERERSARQAEAAAAQAAQTQSRRSTELAALLASEKTQALELRQQLQDLAQRLQQAQEESAQWRVLLGSTKGRMARMPVRRLEIADSAQSPAPRSVARRTMPVRPLRLIRKPMPGR